MLGSEVIKQIQNLIDEYGDLPIEISLNGSDQEENRWSLGNRTWTELCLCTLQSCHQTL